MRKPILGILSVDTKCLMAGALVAWPTLARVNPAQSQGQEQEKTQSDATGPVTQVQATESRPSSEKQNAEPQDQKQDQPQQQSPAESQQPASQAPAQKPQPATPAADASKQKDPSKTTEPIGSNDRIFFTLPNYLTVEKGGQIEPLTAGQKFGIVARGAFDPVELGYFAALAGISQAENSEPGYGQGAEGYGKRYGATFADGTIENFMVGAVFPSVLRTDPRYFRRGKGGFTHRAEYALSRLFVTRTDSGHSVFNVSEIFGSAFAAGISTYSYHPGNDRNVPNTLSVWGTQIGYDGITVILKEFWPDIRHAFKKR